MIRTEDRQAAEEAGYAHVIGRATAPLERRIDRLEAAVLAAKVLIQEKDTEGAWQVLDDAYHATTTVNS